MLVIAHRGASAERPENTLPAFERAIALGDRRSIDVNDLPPTIASASANLDSGGVTSPTLSSTDLEDIERVTIQRIFEQVKGDKALAGKMLGISRATLYRKLKRYNIAIRQHLAAPGSQALQ